MYIHEYVYLIYLYTYVVLFIFISFLNIVSGERGVSAYQMWNETLSILKAFIYFIFNIALRQIALNWH